MAQGRYRQLSSLKNLPIAARYPSDFFFSNFFSWQHARRLGHAVYDYYRGNGTAVPLARLMAPVRKHGTAQHVTVALSMLEADQGRTVLTEENLLEIFDHIYHTRKNLSLTLLNLESITSALAFFLSGALVIAAVLMLNIVFSTGDLAEVAITVSSAILGLSFIFSTSAQHMFDSFVFLFMRHAYDVGDRVRIDGIDPMDVEAIQVRLKCFLPRCGKPFFFAPGAHATLSKRNVLFFSLSSLFFWSFYDCFHGPICSRSFCTRLSRSGTARS